MAKTRTRSRRDEQRQRGGHRDRPRESSRDYGPGKQQHGGNGGKFTQLADFQQRQRDAAFNKLLSLKLTFMTIMVYGPQLPGTTDFADDGKRRQFVSGNHSDPIELAGNIYAGDIILDMLYAGLVLVDMKFKSQGDGRNYLYFRSQNYLRPKDRELLYQGPTIQALVSALKERKFFKNEIYLNEDARSGGAKHTLKFYPTGKGIEAAGALVKPMWVAKGETPPTHAWKLKRVEFQP
jgi:hypothetical protein